MTLHETLRAITTRISGSVTFKLITIGTLILVLLIPVSMVKSLIQEREWRQREVVDEINAKWGKAQIVGGPILSIPYRHTRTDEKGKRTRITRFLHVLPDKLQIDGSVTPHVRYRGIYRAVLYETQLVIQGHFSHPRVNDLQVPETDILWSGAFVTIGVTDMRGIKAGIDGQFNDQTLELEPGVRSRDVLASGVSASVDLHTGNAKYDFRFAIRLNGSQGLSFLPVGRTTHVTLTSSWPDPSFSGSFLPVERNLSQKGFTACWNVLHLNRNYPQHWTGSCYTLDDSVFGVRLFSPVDVYQKTTRTAKYALMFIVFAFMAFFLSEIMHRRRVHPLQYLLVGLAIVIFYALLLSISEHIAFDWAYLIASVAVVSLITVYAQTTMRLTIGAAMVGGTLTILYAYLYVLLQLTDYALLMGSIGLFVLLALVMFVTRRIDWYRVSAINGRLPARGLVSRREVQTLGDTQ